MHRNKLATLHKVTMFHPLEVVCAVCAVCVYCVCVGSATKCGKCEAAIAVKVLGLNC